MRYQVDGIVLLGDLVGCQRNPLLILSGAAADAETLSASRTAAFAMLPR